MDERLALLELFGGQTQPVDLIGAEETLPWENTQPTMAPQNLSQRIQEVLGAKEPDQGGLALEILSGRFGNKGGPSFGDYAQGVVQSAMGKPQIGNPDAASEIMKTMTLINSLQTQQSSMDYRNRALEETMRHNRVSEELMDKRIKNSGYGGGGKPLPPTAIKLQNDGLDIIGTANGINADMDALMGQIDTGQLNLGLMENMENTVRNKLGSGYTTEGSRNYDSFKRTLEKMRNDSLRLNKGVQTEGDAIRAWDEILANINDGQLVKERLAEVKVLNSRAADLQKLNIDNIRANYGHDPMDYTAYENRPASIGAGSQPSGDVPLVKTQEQFDALPSGATYMEEDGKTYRKP